MAGTIRGERCRINQECPTLGFYSPGFAVPSCYDHQTDGWLVAGKCSKLAIQGRYCIPPGIVDVHNWSELGIGAVVGRSAIGESRLPGLQPSSSQLQWERIRRFVSVRNGVRAIAAAGLANFQFAVGSARLLGSSSDFVASQIRSLPVGCKVFSLEATRYELRRVEHDHGADIAERSESWLGLRIGSQHWRMT